MLLVLHGLSTFKILTILSLNYVASTTPKFSAINKVWPSLLIVGNMGMLFLNERYDGYKLGELHAVLGALVRSCPEVGDG